MDASCLICSNASMSFFLIVDKDCVFGTLFKTAFCIELNGFVFVLLCLSDLYKISIQFAAV